VSANTAKNARADMDARVFVQSHCPPKMSTLARIEKYFETPHFAVFSTVNDTLYHHHHPVIMIVL